MLLIKILLINAISINPQGSSTQIFDHVNCVLEDLGYAGRRKKMKVFSALNV